MATPVDFMAAIENCVVIRFVSAEFLILGMNPLLLLVIPTNVAVVGLMNNTWVVLDVEGREPRSHVVKS